MRGAAAWLAFGLLLASPGAIEATGRSDPAAPQPATRSTATALPAELTGTVWQWVSFTTPNEQIEVPEPEQFTIEFAADGTVALQVDCNRGASRLTVGPDRRISFAPIAVTMMACPDDSLGSRFAAELERVASFRLEGDLLLELPMESGTLRFRRAR